MSDTAIDPLDAVLPPEPATPEPEPAPERELTQDGPALRLYLIDASAYIFRAYHALAAPDAQVGRPAGRCRPGLLQHAVGSCCRT